MTAWPYNYHAHTPFGDGHSSSAEHAAEALRRGMATIGISEHAPLGEDVSWTIPFDELGQYRNELLALRNEYAGRLEILCALETDWWPARHECWQRLRRDDWDYFIGSVHYVTVAGGTWAIDHSAARFAEGLEAVFKGDIRAGCDAFFECERAAIETGRFDILGHFDLVKKFNHHGFFFDPKERWYQEMARSVVDAAAQMGIIVEVNTAGLDKSVGEYYPAPWLVEYCVERGIRLTLNADAHSAAELQRHFDTVLPELASLGVRELWRLSDGRWGPVTIAG